MKSLFFFTLVLVSSSAYSELIVYTTTTNLADIVKQVGQENVKVESLCKGTQDPHFLEAKPSYTFKLSKADLLISIGAGLESAWLPLVIRGSRNPKIRVGEKAHLVTSNTIELIDKKYKNISRSQGDVHPEGNPHFMLAPSKSILVAESVMKKLVELDPGNKKDYQKSFEDYKSKIGNVLSDSNKKKLNGLKVISYHKTLSYFYNDFSVNNVDVLEPKPGIPPTASHVLNLISKVKKHQIKKIIIENYFDDNIAKRIQKSSKNITIEIVPVAVNGKKDIDDIFKLYEYLIEKIGKSNGSN